MIPLYWSLLYDSVFKSLRREGYPPSEAHERAFEFCQDVRKLLSPALSAEDAVWLAEKIADRFDPKSSLDWNLKVAEEIAGKLTPKVEEQRLC